MSRSKIELYQYDSNGKFIMKFDSYAELQGIYYSGKKYPLFRSNNEFHELPDGTILSKNKCGRDSILKYKMESSDILSNFNKSKLVDVEIHIFNLIGEKIATFENTSIASTVTGINKPTIYRQIINNNNGFIKKNEIRASFKIKNNAD